ncbi:TraB/GumN family protein [Burkholderiaceae bacterium UC74_6]
MMRKLLPTLAVLLPLLFLHGPARAADDCSAPPPAPSVTAKSKPDHGMLWRISRDGHSSYLYGTLHLGRSEWLVPGPGLTKAWAETQVLATEVDMSDPAALSASISAAKKDDLPAAKFTPAQAQQLMAAVTAACVPAAYVTALSSEHPILQLTTLSALMAKRDGLEIGFGQDFVLTSLAVNNHRPVVGLETAAEQMKALTTASPADMATMINESLKELEDKASRQAMVKLSVAWADGDLDTLAHYEQWCNCANSPAAREWLRRLNDGRNGPLAERIAALHAKGKPALVAVGALHMTGPKALPTLLAAQGFKVERIH